MPTIIIQKNQPKYNVPRYPPTYPQIMQVINISNDQVRRMAQDGHSGYFVCLERHEQPSNDFRPLPYCSAPISGTAPQVRHRQADQGHRSPIPEGRSLFLAGSSIDSRTEALAISSLTLGKRRGVIYSRCVTGVQRAGGPGRDRKELRVRLQG